jgi:hypothetical protein
MIEIFFFRHNGYLKTSNQNQFSPVFAPLLIVKTFFMKPLKKIHAMILVGGLLFGFQHVSAQNIGNNNDSYRTIFGNNTSNGAYGSFSMGYTRIGDYHGFLSGYKGAWITGHSLAIGVAGNAFVTELDAAIFPYSDYSVLAGGYGGLLVEPIIFGMKPVHFSFPVILGAGAVFFDTGYYNDYNSHPTNIEPYFVVEPGLEIEMNICRFFRIGVGGSYRFTTDVDLQYTNFLGLEQQILSSNDMCNFNTYISFKFGKF